MEEEIIDTNKMPFAQQAAEYLDKHGIYDLSRSIIASLAIDRPSNPTEYIINKLKQPKSLKIFVICNHPKLSDIVSNFLASEYQSPLQTFDNQETNIDCKFRNKDVFVYLACTHTFLCIRSNRKYSIP